jgi:TPP-dependent pyruvate/acetoin dehydrogenase alpha subunit
LVKGTSHLSLGQEAVAAGFAGAMQPGDLSFASYRGHAHTLARGVPVTKVLGELMQRDIGLMRGKGGSMHLTSVEHGVMGSYAIIGAHLPIALRRRLARAVQGPKGHFGLLLRRRHGQYFSRGAQLCGGVEAAGHLRVRE